MEQSSSTASEQPSTVHDSTTTTTKSSTTGIDIQDALTILSERSSQKEGEHHKHNDNINGGGGGGGCGCNQSIPKGGKSMGQTIDILEPKNDKDNDEMSLEEKKKLLEQERLERSKKIQEELQNMTSSELIKTVLQAQQDRVVTYKLYDEGLQQSLTTGNMSLYPIACAKATASFSVLSDTINAVLAQLKLNHNNKKSQTSMLTKIITKLQQEEKEKLNLTAALHLEKIRQVGASSENDERTMNLLSQGITTLIQKISQRVQNINECIEELRCEAMEDE